MGVIHRAESGRLVVRSALLIFRELDLILLVLALGLRAQLRIEHGLKILLEVFRVGMRDGDVVIESSAAQDKPLLPG